MPVTSPLCPFYGMHASLEQRIFVGSGGGNQCGLIVSSFSPCSMEIAGNVPEWEKCRFKADRKDPLITLRDFKVFPLAGDGPRLSFLEWFLERTAKPTTGVD